MAGPDQVRGNLDMMLLAVLAAGPGHGYAVLQQLRERSDAAFDLPEGTVYPALHRLEQAGLLASAWDATSGRRRRVYTLTKRGRSVLKTKQAEWSGFVHAVEAV